MKSVPVEKLSERVKVWVEQATAYQNGDGQTHLLPEKYREGLTLSLAQCAYELQQIIDDASES